MELLVGPGLEIVGPSSLMERRDDSDSGLDDSSDSSIGAPDDSEEKEEEEEEEEEQEEEDDDNGRVKENGDASPEDSKLKLKKGLGSLGSLASLEDSLPSKRGLSLHMSGKSKSFTNLSEASIGSVKDLEKTEHPFNKKRRILRWSRRNYYRGHNPKSMPVLPLIEDDDDEEDDDEDEVQRQQQKNHQLGQQSSDSRGAGFPGIKQHPRVFKSSSYSCFSLADLPEDEEDD